MAQYTLSPQLKLETVATISNALDNDSLRKLLTQGSELLSSPTNVRGANYQRYVIPRLLGIKTKKFYMDEYLANGTIKTLAVNTVKEFGVTLKEYASEIQTIHIRDIEQVGLDALLPRFIANIGRSLTKTYNMIMLETIYVQTALGRVAEGQATDANTVKGSIIDTSAFDFLDGDTSDQRIAKARNLANVVRLAVTEIRELKNEESQYFDVKQLGLLFSPRMNLILQSEAIQLYSPLLNQAAYINGVLADSKFYDVPVFIHNQLDDPITQRNAGKGKGSVLGILFYSGAMVAPFAFEGVMNFDKEPGWNVYKFGSEFNSGCALIFPYLYTVFANCGPVADRTATTVSKSGLTAVTRVVPKDIDITAVVQEKLAEYRDSSDTTAPAGRTTSPANATDGKGK